MDWSDGGDGEALQPFLTGRIWRVRHLGRGIETAARIENEKGRGTEGRRRIVVVSRVDYFVWSLRSGKQGDAVSKVARGHQIRRPSARFGTGSRLGECSGQGGGVGVYQY